MKLTKPQDMCSGLSKLEEAIVRFEAEFSSAPKDQEYYHLVILGEYNRTICDEIQKLYSEAGWSMVKCRTSSENGERGGLTGLMLYK